MRLTWSGAAATLVAASMMVVGLDWATYGVTGDSLILGRVNHAQRTTTLVNDGTGPALSLQTQGHAGPSLRVGSDAKVKLLNADLLDGRHASVLATRAQTFRAGRRRDVIQGGFAAWRLNVDPGVFQASFNVLAFPTATPALELICGVVDLSTFGSRTRVYVADSASSSGTFPAAVSGAEAIRIKPGADPGLICAADSDFALFKPATASLTPINHRSGGPAEPVTMRRGHVGFGR